jgi:integrase
MAKLPRVITRRWEYPKGSGVFQEAYKVQYWHNGKRKSGGQFERLKDAEARAAELAAELRIGIHTPKSGTVRFSEALLAYTAELKKRVRHGDMTKHGLATSIFRLERYALPFLGEKMLTELDNRACKQFLDHLRDRGYAPKTVQGAIQSVSAVLFFSVEQGWLVRNVLRDNPLKLPKAKRKTKTFSETDIQALIDASQRQDRNEHLVIFVNRRVFVALGAHAGNRPGESFALHWEDIDFARMLITIQRSINRYDGLKGTKTGTVRQVPLTPQIYSALSDVARYWTIHDLATAEGYRSYKPSAVSLRVQDMWERRGEIAIPPRTGHVILTRNLRPMTTGCSGFWWKLMEKAKLLNDDGSTKFTPHDLRHWNASTKLGHNLPITDTARSLGHSNSATTLEVYAHAIPGSDAVRQVSMEIDAKFSPRALTAPVTPSEANRGKLTEDQVREIRARVKAGHKLLHIAKDMQCSLGTVHAVGTGRIYRWVA